MNETLADWVDKVALPRLRNLVPGYIITWMMDSDHSSDLEPGAFRMGILHPNGYRAYCNFYSEEFERNDDEGMKKLLEVRLYVLGASLTGMAEEFLEVAKLFPQD